jgi:hypothetical protein
VRCTRQYVNHRSMRRRLHRHREAVTASHTAAGMLPFSCFSTAKTPISVVRVEFSFHCCTVRLPFFVRTALSLRVIARFSPFQWHISIPLPHWNRYRAYLPLKCKVYYIKSKLNLSIPSRDVKFFMYLC